jgi:DNA-binding transcriptional LysR family regulator
VPDINWLLRLGASKDKPRQPVLTVNNVYAILRACENGVGLAALPGYMIDGSNLMRVLPEVEEPRIDAYFVYPEELRNSKRIQVFRDFLIRKIAQAQLQ